jgi:predicted ester cyclase
MSTDENKEIARRFVEGVMSGQHVERIDEFVAPDAVHHEPGGPQNYREALGGVFGDPNLNWQFIVEHIVAEGDMVVVRCMASYTIWTDQGPYGIPYQPGTRASVWHAHFFRIVDGMIVEHWPVRDIWDAVRQFNAPVQNEGG